MTAARSTRKYRKNRDILKAQRLPCWLCGQAITYTARFPHPDSFSADHVKLFSTHPHLRDELSNLRAAHLRCNQGRGDRPPPEPLGQLSRDW